MKLEKVSKGVYNAALSWVERTVTVHIVLSNVLVQMFWLVSCSYAFENLLCFVHGQRPTNKGNREQKPITKKLAEFHNQFVLLTMVSVKSPVY